MPFFLRSCLVLACSLPLQALAAPSASAPVYGEQLQGFEYPYPLHHFNFDSQGQTLQMGYMDVAPTGPANGHTAVLLHGKNFCAATWGDSIKALSAAGYRVVAPDQIGFCTSSKPASYQYSFQQLSANTHALLDSLGVDKASIIGHSTGGMLGTAMHCSSPRKPSSWCWSIQSVWRTGKPSACHGAVLTSGTHGN